MLLLHQSHPLAKRSWVLAVLLLCLGASRGCKTFQSYTPAPIPAGENVRVINLAYDAAATAAVKVDTANPARFSLPYRASSGFFAKPGGQYSFEFISPSVDGSDFYNKKLITVSYAKNTTVFMYSNPAAPSGKRVNNPFVFIDSVLSAPPGRATVKLFNFSNFYGIPFSNTYVWFGAVDVNAPGAFRLTTTDAYGRGDLINNDPTSAIVPQNNVRSLAAGTYVISLGSVLYRDKAAGLTQLQSAYKPVTLQERHTYTAVLTGTADVTDQIPLDVVLYDDADNTTQVLVQDLTTSLVRFIDAAYNVSDYQPGLYYGLDFRVDDELYVTGLRYLYNTSPYSAGGGSNRADSTTVGYGNQAPVGIHSVGVFPSGATGPALATASLNIANGVSSTVIAAPHGYNTTALDLIALTDSGSAPEGGVLKIRFVNLVTNLGGPVDVYFNGTNGAQSFNGPVAFKLGFQQASGYYKFFFSPTDNFNNPTLSLNPAGSGSQLPGSAQNLLQNTGYLGPGACTQIVPPFALSCLVPTLQHMELNNTYTILITGELGNTDKRASMEYRLYVDHQL